MHRKSLFISPFIPLPPPSLGLPFGLLLPLVISLCCLTLIWTLVFLSLPVPCLSHANTPADVVGNAKPLKGSHEGGRDPGAGKSHGQKSRLRQHQGPFVTTAKCSPLTAVSTTYSLFPILCERSDIQKSQIVLQTTFWSFQWEWHSGSAQNCSHHEELGVRGAWGHLHTWLLFRLKSGGMSEDLSHFQMLFILFYNGFLKVKHYVNNTVLILTAFPTSL